MNCLFYPSLPYLEPTEHSQQFVFPYEQAKRRVHTQKRKGDTPPYTPCPSVFCVCIVFSLPARGMAEMVHHPK